MSSVYDPSNVLANLQKFHQFFKRKIIQSNVWMCLFCSFVLMKVDEVTLLCQQAYIFEGTCVMGHILLLIALMEHFYFGGKH